MGVSKSTLWFMQWLEVCAVSCFGKKVLLPNNRLKSSTSVCVHVSTAASKQSCEETGRRGLIVFTNPNKEFESLGREVSGAQT